MKEIKNHIENQLALIKKKGFLGFTALEIADVYLDILKQIYKIENNR